MLALKKRPTDTLRGAVLLGTLIVVLAGCGSTSSQATVESLPTMTAILPTATIAPTAASERVWKKQAVGASNVTITFYSGPGGSACIRIQLDAAASAPVEKCAVSGTLVAIQGTTTDSAGKLYTIVAGRYALLEGVPGLGKTRLIRTLADTLHLQFSRIQFTPDLMPADATGTNIMEEDDQGRRAFRFQPGPIFANLVLADEINRATPKTQSALLEAMQEKTVTVANTSYHLDLPFFVLATQNPLEMEIGRA